APAQQQPPPIPAKAGTQIQAASGARSRGDERPTASFAYAKLDPFFEVRTPTQNFGPARIAGGAFVTPLARRLAAENGIDLGAIAPSGPHGRIVARDVEAALAGGRRAAPALQTGASAEQVKALYQGVPFTEVPLDGMRATIARRLVEAKQTIPHFYLTM